LDKTNVVNGISLKMLLSLFEHSIHSHAAVFHSRHKKFYEYPGSSNNRSCINLSWKDNTRCFSSLFFFVTTRWCTGVYVGVIKEWMIILSFILFKFICGQFRINSSKK